MVDPELVERITHLPARERLELIEVLTRSLHTMVREDERVSISAADAARANQASTETLSAIQHLAVSLRLRVPADSSLHQLRGIAATAMIPSTKDGIREGIADALACPFPN